MRSHALQVLVASLMLSGCRSIASAPPPATAPPQDERTQALFDMPWSDRSAFGAGLVESQQSVLSGLAGASVYHLALEIAPDLSTVDGVAGSPLHQHRIVSRSTRWRFTCFPTCSAGR